MAKVVAPTGRAFVFQDEAVPSAVELDVDDERYMTPDVSIQSQLERAIPGMADAMPRWLSRSSRRAVGRHGMTRGRTEAVLLAALRAVAPAVRAERSADRANMATCSWLGGYERGETSIGGSVVLVVVREAGGQEAPSQVLERASWG